MVIEWLKFKMAPELREQFIQVDATVWTPFLASYPGFLSKEVWINPAEAAAVVMVIHWASKEAWKAIPEEPIKAVEQQFNQAFGHPYELLEGVEYQVRKFPQRS